MRFHQNPHLPGEKDHWDFPGKERVLGRKFFGSDVPSRYQLQGTQLTITWMLPLWIHHDIYWSVGPGPSQLVVEHSRSIKARSVLPAWWRFHLISSFGQSVSSQHSWTVLQSEALSQISLPSLLPMSDQHDGLKAFPACLQPTVPSSQYEVSPHIKHVSFTSLRNLN